MTASAAEDLRWRQRSFGAVARHASRYGVGPLAVFEAPQHRGAADLEPVVAAERDHVADGVVELDRRHPAADHGARVRASLNTCGTRHARSTTRRPRGARCRDWGGGRRPRIPTTACCPSTPEAKAPRRVRAAARPEHAERTKSTVCELVSRVMCQNAMSTREIETNEKSSDATVASQRWTSMGTSKKPKILV